MTTSRLVPNDSRSIFGWAMYDWANSAFVTTSATALLPVYFASEIVPDEGYSLFGRTMEAQTLWAYALAVGTLLIFVTSPVLGTIADSTGARKRMLASFALLGGLGATLFGVLGPGDVVLTFALLLVAHFGLSSSNVFYDAYLPDLTTPATIHRVSAKGFAFGYLGGGVHFGLSLLLVLFHESVGMSEASAVRVAMATAGVWWLGFTVFALRRLPIAGRKAGRLGGVGAVAKQGIRQVLSTTRSLRRRRELLLFLLAYLIYIDGVHAVISLAAVYASDTLELSTTVIAGTILLVQLLAFGGALIFGRLADRTSAKGAILVSLAVWAIASVAGSWLPEGEPVPFLALAVVAGVVLGGTSALSRSLYGSMIPTYAAGEYFGFFGVVSRLSAVGGPLMFAVVSDRTGSGRLAFVSLAFFFVLGGAVLLAVDVRAGQAAADALEISG